MRKKLLFGLLIVLIGAQSVFAQRKLTIKMASPVPENTPWGQCLNQIASDWQRITNGEVEIRIYHNGVAGTEETVVRNLRINQIQAAVLSTFGMYEIAPEIMTLSAPFLIRTDDELDAVLSGIKPEMEARINSKGFHTLAWARVGWVKVFSKLPVFTPPDLKKQKLGMNGEQSEINQAFKSMGFQMIPVAHNDILIALNGGMVDAVLQSPIAVGSLQIFGLAKNMASINIAPFMGGVILNRRTWNAVPEKYKPQLIEATRRAESELDQKIRTLENDIVKTMSGYGLVVNQLSPAQEQSWFDEMEKINPGLIGTAFDRDIYGRIDTILRRMRGGGR